MPDAHRLLANLDAARRDLAEHDYEPGMIYTLYSGPETYRGHPWFEVIPNTLDRMLFDEYIDRVARLRAAETEIEDEILHHGEIETEAGIWRLNLDGRVQFFRYPPQEAR